MACFSQDAWQRNQAIYDKILVMPFQQDLINGTLTQARFKFYMLQDAHYLEGFARALALTAAKGMHAQHVAHFAGAAQTAIMVERSLHADFFGQFGIGPHEFAESAPTPACAHYMNYLLRVTALEPFEVALAALLPCFWIYREVGKHIYARAAAGNPYQAWIDTYAGTEFNQAVDAVLAVVNEVAQEASPRMVLKMHQAFTRAVQLEWMFWDAAYRDEAWPV